MDWTADIDSVNPWLYVLAMVVTCVTVVSALELVVFDGDLGFAVVQGVVGGAVLAAVFLSGAGRS